MKTLKKTLRITILMLTGCFMLSCGGEGGNDEQMAELEELRERIKRDDEFREGWARESRIIDSLLTQISGVTADANNGLLGDNLEDKARNVQQIIEEVNERIAQLEKEVKMQKGKVNKMPNLIQNLRKQKILLLEQDSLIQNLQQQVEQGEVKIAKLTTEVDLKGKTISEQEAAINQKIAELNAKEQELAAKQRELEETKNSSVAALKKQRNNFYVGAGQELISTVKLAPGMKPKKKEQLLGQAWDYICEAYQNGDFNAKTSLEILQRDRKLGKFVSNKSCD